MPGGPGGFQVHKPGALFNPTDWFEKPNQDHLHKLIAFCKRGAFEIAP